MFLFMGVSQLQRGPANTGPSMNVCGREDCKVLLALVAKSTLYLKSRHAYESQ